MGLNQSRRRCELLAGHDLAGLAVADTGADPVEPVEVGIVLLDGGQVDEQPRTWLTRPTGPITAHVTRCHGLDRTHVRNAPPVHAIAAEIRDAVGDRIIVTHRGREIVDLLPPAATPSGARVLDLRTLAGRLWPASSRSLGMMLQYTGIKVPGLLGRAGHDALAIALLMSTMVRHIDVTATRSGYPVSIERVFEWATPVGGAAC